MSFSVLLAIYYSDSKEYLNQALSSVWSKQTLLPGQVVIVKDGPLPADVNQVLADWRGVLGPRLTLLDLPLNKGLGAALNAGLEACEFELVARMDSDDIAFPERFEMQVEFLDSNPDIDILGSYVQEISQDGNVLGIREVPESHDVLFRNLWACPLIHPTIMFRRSKILRAGNYNPMLRRRQDYELWFRCAEIGLRFHNLPLPLLYYRFGAHTHRKQSPKISFQQGVIGYRGSQRIGLPFSRRLACFIPFVRSLLPQSLQHSAYRVLSRFDPRHTKK